MAAADSSGCCRQYADRPARLPLGVAGSGGTDRVRGAMECAYSLKAGQTLGHA